MASSFFDLLAKNRPDVKTNQALLLLGMQNDFLAADGKLQVTGSGEFLSNIKNIIPIFRDNAGDVFWIQTEYVEDRFVNDHSGEGDIVLVEAEGLESATEESGDDVPKALPQIPSGKAKSPHHGRRALDLFKRVSGRRRSIRAPSPLMAAPPPPEEEELFLSSTSRKGPACVPSQPGHEFESSIITLLDSSTDPVFTTSHYSAFNSTSLLVVLRAKLITELYICGCLTNVSVYATALDAARHGFSIYLLEDCLGYRKPTRHEEALKQMCELMGAQITTSKEIITALLRPDELESTPADVGADEGKGLHALVGKLTIHEKAASKAAETRSSQEPEPSRNFDRRSVNKSHIKSGGSRKDIESEIDRNPALRLEVDGSAEDTREVPALALPPSHRGARDRMSPDPKQNLVKSKIRMRNRPKKEPKTEDEKSKSKQPEPKSPKNPGEGPAKSNVVAESSAGSATATNTRTKESVQEVDTPTKKEHSLKAAKSQPLLSDPRLEPSQSPKSPVRPHSLAVLSSNSQSSHDSNLPTPHSDKSSRPSSLSAMGKKNQSLATFPTLGPDDNIGEGDSQIIYDFFPDTLTHKRRSPNLVKDEIFGWLYNEVHWQKMYHAQGEVPRLVCVQGEFGKHGSMPVYRHPSDQSLPLLHFTPAVQMIREQVEKLVKHPVNHVLIQLYRSGNDYISEHSDKSLDIVRGSKIVNVSFGAQRTMRLRTKRSAKAAHSGDANAYSKESLQRNTQRIHMPHNSMFVLGQDSNMRWLHGINADKRPKEERSEAETAYSGMRISLTFRLIGTFLDSESKQIWGQGATSKDRTNASEVINDDDEETDKMIYAFGKENQSTEFDWDAVYGAGFDVLHFRKPPPESPIFFQSHDSIENQQVALCLAELGLAHSVCEAPATDKEYERGRQVCFRDIDINHTELNGVTSILLYLDRYHQLDRSEAGKAVAAVAYPAITTIEALRKCWNGREETRANAEDVAEYLEELEEMQKLHGGDYIAGHRFSIADCAAWPALNAIVEGWGGWKKDKYPKLTAYYEKLWSKRKTVTKLRKELPRIQ